MKLVLFFCNYIDKFVKFGVEFANLRVDIARQSTSASDLLAGQTTSSWGKQFDLTYKQINQLIPVVEKFARNQNVSFSTLTI